MIMTLLEAWLGYLSVVCLHNKLAETVDESGYDRLVDFLEFNILPLDSDIQVHVLQLFHSLVDL